jgi:uncharacterized membrane protein
MKSSLQGALTALILLIALVAAFGPAINHMPKNTLRLFVGTILLLLGMQWLRKAILRYGGVIAIHDEAKIFHDEVAEAAQHAVNSRFKVHDWYSFVMSFKGVLLEGLEVIFIVISFADARIEQNKYAFIEAAIGALVAAIAAITIGLIAHKPLTKVPENTMKYGVGLMLTAFGMFWALEGLNVSWPHNELSIIFILITLFALTQVAIKVVVMRKPVRSKKLLFKELENSSSFVTRSFYFWWDFIIGDDWRMALVLGLALAVSSIVGAGIAIVATALVVALALGVLLPV